jgi:hypothetical protein
VLQLCRDNGFEPRLSSPLTDLVTATLQAATGRGVTMVPASMANVQFPGIAYRPCDRARRPTWTCTAST